MKKLLIVYQEEDKGVIAYKIAIERKCRANNIKIEEFVATTTEKTLQVINKTSSDGYILLQPLRGINLDYLRKNIRTNSKDLDCFTYQSLGQVMDKNFGSMPQTCRAIIKHLDNIDLAGKDIIIANSTNVIGKPLAMYLNAKKATVTLFNSKTRNQKDKIRKADIFISAIGKPNYYNKEYFKNGQTLIDVGTSYVDNKLVGDIFYEDLKNLDVNLVTSKEVASITTSCLVESIWKGKNMEEKINEMLEDIDFEEKYELYGTKVDPKKVQMFFLNVLKYFVTILVILNSILFLLLEKMTLVKFLILFALVAFPHFKIHQNKRLIEGKKKRLDDKKENIRQQLGPKLGDLLINEYYKMNEQILFYDLVKSKKRMLNEIFKKEKQDYTEAETKLLKSLY